MKKVFFIFLLTVSSALLFAKDITLYSDSDKNLYLEKDIEEIFESAVKLSQQNISNKKINLINEGERPNLYIGWGEELNPKVKFPHINIKYEEDEYKQLNINIDVCRSEKDRSNYLIIYYIANLNKDEKINLFEKIIEGAAAVLAPDEEKNELELSLIDSFDFNDYYPADFNADSAKVKSSAGDDYVIYNNSNGEINSFSPFWSRQISFSEKLSDLETDLQSYVPLFVDNDMIKLVSGAKQKSYVFDKNGKFLRAETLVIPDGNVYVTTYTDTGIPLYFDRGKNYFNSKLIKAGSNGLPLKEYTFIQGPKKNSAKGNYGDYWVERYDGTCVYNSEGELINVIFKSGETDSKFHLSFVDKDNNFLILDNFANAIEKYDYHGKKLWSGKLPEICKNSYLFDYRDGVLYFQNKGTTIIRVKDPDCKLPSEMEKLVLLNKKLKDINSRSRNAECYKQMADIYLANGGISAAYSYLKKYLEYSPADSKAREQMLNCELILAKESARNHAEKAIALYEEFGEETADKEYKAAMKILERYRKYFPQDEDLQKIYSDLKITFGSEAGEMTVSSLEVMSVELGVLFPALMNVYACEPSGVLKVKNNSKTTVKNVELKSYVRKYMDFESASDVIVEIKPGETVSIPVRTVLNSQAMKVNENVNLQMQLTLSWQENSLQKKQVITRPVTMYKKSAIVWKDTSMLSCFILPNDKTVTDFAFNAIMMNEKKVLSHNISNAILICNAVGNLPVKYVSDPAAPVIEQLGNEYAVDTVRLPFETLKLKGGDCDDLTVLLCSLMEAAGIRTALITTPGHIFIAFNTGRSYNSMWDNLPDDYSALNVDGEAWIPVEVTAVGEGFMNAWKIACKTLNEEDFEFVSVSDAMLRYQSVTVDELDNTVSNLKVAEKVKDINDRCFDEIKELFVKASPVSEEECEDAGELNEIAEAYFELNDIESAIKTLLRAYKIDSKNKAVVSNLSGLYRLKGDETNSKKYGKIAETLPDAVNSENNSSSRTSRGDDKSSVSMTGSSHVERGVRFREKDGVVKRPRPVSSSIGSATVTQKSVQTASSRADNKNIFEWKK